MDIIISYSFTILIDIAFAHLLLSRKRCIKDSFFLFIVNFIIFLIGYGLYKSYLINTNFSQYTPTILGFTFIIYIILAFKESLSKKIFTIFTIRLFSIIILLISSYVMGLFNISNFNEYKSQSILLRNIIQLMLIPIVYLYVKRPYKEVLKCISNNLTNLATFYSVIIFLFLNNYYQFNPFNNIHSNEILGNLFFVFIIILSYLIIFISIYYVNKNTELEYKFNIIDAQIEIQKQNYKTLNKSLEKYYAFRHDIRHHILVIKSLMETKNYIAASEYLEEFNEHEISKNVDVLCKNFTVDSILKYYRSTALQNNIDFNIYANIPQDIKIDNLELSVVIGNCVENAIEACNNIVDKSEKYINGKAEIKGSQLIIKIVNSFNGHVIEVDNIIRTSKTGKEHGIGLYNVRNIAKKYNGFFDVKYNNNEFEVDVVMNLN